MVCSSIFVLAPAKSVMCLLLITTLIRTCEAAVSTNVLRFLIKTWLQSLGEEQRYAGKFAAKCLLSDFQTCHGCDENKLASGSAIAMCSGCVVTSLRWQLASFATHTRLHAVIKPIWTSSYLTCIEIVPYWKAQPAKGRAREHLQWAQHSAAAQILIQLPGTVLL